MYDLIIVGAGPAGSTLARLVGEKRKVLLIDRRQLNIVSFQENCSGSSMQNASSLGSSNQIQFGKGHVQKNQDSENNSIYSFSKACGGLLAPDAQKMLARLGLGVPREVLTGPQLFTVRTIDIKNRTERHYQRHYINVDREMFDSWLVSIIPSSVDKAMGCIFKSFVESKDSITVKYNKSGKEYSAKAKILVGADGAFSKVRRQLYPDLVIKKQYISIQEWFQTEKSLPYFSAIFDPDITDFYSWTIPKGNYMILGTAVTPSNNVLNRFELLKTKLKDYDFSLEKSVRTEGAYLLRPVGMKQPVTGKSNTALIGEAAGFVSPSSAEGLSYAFRSAVAFAEAINESMNGFQQRYSSNVQKLKFNILLKNLKSPAMYNPLLRKLIMSTGILSIDRLKV